MRIWWNGYVYLFMSEYGRDESVPYAWRSVSWLFRGWMLGVYRVFRGYFVGECWVFTECFVVISWMFVALLTIRSQRNGRLLAAVGDRFIAPAYLYSICICNPFETHLCNVRNVFVICVLHIRRVKVWFLRCKSMVFGVQKGGFCRARNRFLHCKSMVFVFWMLCCCNLFGMLWQFVSNILAIRSQCFGNPSAAVGGQFIAPVSTNTPKLYCVFMPLALQFASFRHIKPFGLDWRTGTMKLPLCLMYCSLPYIYAINGYCVLFAAIYFAP